MFDVMAARLPEDVKPSPSARARLVLDNHNLDIKTYLDWKATDVAAVRSDDFLVSLLEVLADKMGYDLHRTVQDVYTRTFYLTADVASSQDVFSGSTVGRIREYLGQPTIFTTGPSPFRAGVSANTDYRTITAIRYLSHDSDNVSLGDEPKVRGDGLGFNVIDIDFGLLYLQFVLWWKNNPNAQSEHRLGIPTFISMCVLPALKRTQFAIAFMNRARRIADGVDLDTEQVRLTRVFSPRDAGVTGMLTEVVGYFMRRECTFEYLVGTLPVPGVSTLGMAQTMPDVPPTRQIGWLFVLARFNLLHYLFAVGRVDPDRVARFSGINSVIRSTNRMYNDNSLGQCFNQTQQTKLKERLDRLLLNTGRW